MQPDDQVLMATKTVYTTYIRMAEVVVMYVEYF